MTIGRFAVVTVALVVIGLVVLDWWLHRDDGIVEQRTAFEDVRLGRRVALGVLFAALAAGAWVVGTIHIVLVLLYLPIAGVLVVVLDAGVIQRIFPLQRTPDQVARLLQGFLDDTASEGDWRSFAFQRIENPALDAIRSRLLFEGSGEPPQRKTLVRECLDELHRGGAALGGSTRVSAPPDRAARFLRFCRAARFYRVAVVGATPLLAVILFLTPATPTGIRVAIASAAVYLGLIAAWSQHTRSYVCWQCGQRFHYRDGGLAQFTNTCLHCGAPRPHIWTKAVPN